MSINERAAGQMLKIEGTIVTSYVGNESNISIPEGITEIAPCAFWCAEFERIYLPDTIIKIGAKAFCRCKKLREIRIPKTVTSIGESVFGECINLEKVELPETITDINEAAFYNCSQLKQINLNDNIRTIGTMSFANCSSLKSINIPALLTKIDVGVFDGCGFSTLHIPEGVKFIESAAFANNPFLRSAHLPDSLDYIDPSAFVECNKYDTGFVTVYAHSNTYAAEQAKSDKLIQCKFKELPAEADLDVQMCEIFKRLNDTLESTID